MITQKRTSRRDEVTEQWWKKLHLSPQQLQAEKLSPWPTKYKAELKRCGTPDAAMLTEGFRSLWLALPESVRERQDHTIIAWATIACVLANINDETTKSFASSLGEIDSATDKPVVSELRFQQLQNAKSVDEFLTRLLRIIKQIKGVAEPVGLSTDILAWFDEHHSRQPRKADKRIAVKWAMDYYVPNKSNKKA